MTNALSTKFAGDYKIKEKPKNIGIKIGNTYTLADGSGGTRQVTIVSIRNLDGDIVIYYKWRKGNGKLFEFLTGGSWMNDSRTLPVFKTQLLEYGQMKEIELIYNEKKQELETN